MSGGATISGATVNRDGSIALKFEDVDGTLAIAGDDISTLPVNVNGKTYYFENNAILNNTAEKATAVTVLSGNFDAEEYDKLRTIVGQSTGRQNFTGNDLDNVIYAGDGGGTLDGVSGKNTLVGGEGTDTFVHNGGSKKAVTTIQNYDEESDVISGITSENTSKVSVSNRTTTFTLDDGSKVIVKNIGTGKNPGVRFAGERSVLSFDSNVVYTKSGDSVTSATLMSAFKGKFDGKSKIGTAAGTVTIDGSGVSAKNNVNIVGTTGNDVIIANDAKRATLQGGAGNDSLYGGDGADRFVYASSDSGADVIVDFDCSKDSINIGKKVTDIDGGKFTIGTGDSFSIRNFAEGGRYDANHTLYKISNKLYGFDGDEFITAKNNKTGKADLTAISKAVSQGDYSDGYAVIELSGSVTTSFKKNNKDYTFTTSGGFVKNSK